MDKSKKIIILTPNPFKIKGLLLDSVPNAICSWSFRRLSSTYTGYCCQVRNASSGQVLNVGFTSDGVVDIQAILAWNAGSSDISIMYDQSGNGRNLTASVSKWMRLVNSGVPYLKNGKIAGNLNTYASPYYSAGSFPQFGFGNDFTWFSVTGADTALNTNIVATTASNMSAAIVAYRDTNLTNYSTKFHTFNTGALYLTQSQPVGLNSLVVGTTIVKNKQLLSWDNSIKSNGSITTVAGTDTSNLILFNQNFKGWFHEFIGYSREHTKYRATIEENMYNYWS